MNLLRSPKAKLYAAIALLGVLGLAVSTRGFDLVTAARWILGAGALVGLGFWTVRTKTGTKPFAPLPRLNVIARTGLSPKCSLALVEADGKTLLVAFGDGFAQFAEAPVKRAAPKSRRPRKVTAP